MNRAVLVVAGAALVVAMRASAHDTWIIPRADLESGKVAILDVTTGAAFPSTGSAPHADAFVSGGWRLGKKTGPIGGRAEADSVLALALVPDGGGTAVVWVTFAPKTIDLTETQVAEYLDEIGASDAVRRAWNGAGPDRKWHETYTKYAKTFARASGVGDDVDCLAPAGLAFELVPDRDPTGLAPGDTLTVRALEGKDGVAGVTIGAVCGSDGSVVSQAANPAGYVRVAITRDGPWMLRATELRRQPDGTWHSDFTTLTFVVGGH